jgi:hypothetical protein
MKHEHRQEDGGDSACPPYRPCASCDDDVVPVWGVSHLGRVHEEGMKNVLNSAREPLLDVVFHLSIKYDEYRCP